jgi:membrane-bound metal-dependent hydrolase YbcI (DUF457 family)
VSWAAHDLEPYLIKAHLPATKISIVFCLLGSYSPDILTKWAVYGLDFAGHRKLVDDPVKLHRGFPGVGFTHSLAFVALVAGLIFWLSKKRLWSISFLIGGIAHVLSDTLDSVGVMLLFPFSTWHLHFDAWEYVGQAGRQKDAIAYYTSLGGAWDILWVVLLLFTWRRLRTEHFLTHVAPHDPLWPWLIKRTNTAAALTLYRASAFFGVASTIAWFVWALFVNDFHPHLDWTPGGPHWAPRIGPP